MIIVLKPQSTKQMVDNFVDSLQKNYDVKVNEWVGTQSTVLGLIGDTSAIDIDYISGTAAELGYCLQCAGGQRTL